MNSRALFFLFCIGLLASCAGTSRLSKERTPIPYTQRYIDAQIKYRFFLDDPFSHSPRLQITMPVKILSMNAECQVVVKNFNEVLDTIQWPVNTSQLETDFENQGIFGIRTFTICADQEERILLESKWSAAASSPGHVSAFQFLVGNELFNGNTLPYEEDVIVYYEGKPVSGAKIDYFGDEFSFPMAPPVKKSPAPLSTQPMSSSTIDSTFYFSHTGRYRVYYGGEFKDVMACQPAFPKVTTSQQVARTLRFIAKNEEYQKIIKSDKVKKSIDNFWLDIGGSQERSKVLIKEFYGRVERANKFFTMSKPGWMSDRGMLYIIYGQPDIVDINDETEIWQYVNYLDDTFSFTFDLRDGDMSFQRSDRYAETWNRAVYNWRNGIISKLSF